MWILWKFSQNAYFSKRNKLLKFKKNNEQFLGYLFLEKIKLSI
jgi:hypothetical protein